MPGTAWQAAQVRCDHTTRSGFRGRGTDGLFLRIAFDANRSGSDISIKIDGKRCIQSRWLAIVYQDAFAGRQSEQGMVETQPVPREDGERLFGRCLVSCRCQDHNIVGGDLIPQRIDARQGRVAAVAMSVVRDGDAVNVDEPRLRQSRQSQLRHDESLHSDWIGMEAPFLCRSMILSDNREPLFRIMSLAEA